MQTVIIFGLGKMYDAIKLYIHSNYDIVALTDNDMQKRRLYQDTKKVIEPDQINDLEFDYVLISTTDLYADAIRVQLASLGVPDHKLMFITTDMQTSVSGQMYEASGIKVLVNSFCDCIVFYEVFIWGSYPPPLKDGDYICIDIGSNIGCASLFFASQPNVVKVFSFELMPTTYADAIKNFNLNPDYAYKIDARRYGLGGETKKVFISNHLYSGGISMVAKASEDLPKVECEVRKSSEVLYEILKQKQSGIKVMLKIDCEGAEWEIFDDLYRNDLLPCFDIITGELHLFDNLEIHRIKTFQSWLTGYGFSFSNWEEVLQNQFYAFTAVKE